MSPYVVLPLHNKLLFYFVLVGVIPDWCFLLLSVVPWEEKASCGDEGWELLGVIQCRALIRGPKRSQIAGSTSWVLIQSIRRKSPSLCISEHSPSLCISEHHIGRGRSAVASAWPPPERFPYLFIGQWETHWSDEGTYRVKSDGCGR